MRARRRRLQRTRQARRRRANRIRTIAVIGLVGIGSAALVGAVAMNSVASNLEAKQSELKEIRLGQNTRVYDRFGKPLGYIAGTTNRTMVRSKRIPQTLKDATVAIEDKRFYEHHGVDYYRLFGATLRNVTSNGPQQGGSTITMQLARNLIPGGATAARNIERKVEETYLALQYEKKYTKDEILTRYLNSVFYGNFALGVQAAALTYFDRDVSKINLVQAALLAGLPQAPSAYNPFANPQAAKERRNQVLQEMADQGYIPQEQADRAKQSGLNLKRGNAYRGAQREEYFFEYVRQRLIASFGEREVEKGGFKVQTTIDPTLQTYAKDAINGQLGQSDDPAAAIVMVDSRKGFIRTMQSSVTFSAQNQFNFATQAKRQPGSTFKTFVLTRAIEQGINPYTTSYVSKPLKFTDPIWGPST
ncbi:MAG: transglycosylase domain-containing protein [Thermoleophilia bacterium]